MASAEAADGALADPAKGVGVPPRPVRCVSVAPPMDTHLRTDDVPFRGRSSEFKRTVHQSFRYI